MLVPNGLRNNAFKDVKIPSNKDFFARVGLGSAGVAANYTGDELAKPNQSKIDQILEADREYARFLQSEKNDDNK